MLEVDKEVSELALVLVVLDVMVEQDCAPIDVSPHRILVVVQVQHETPGTLLALVALECHLQSGRTKNKLGERGGERER